MEAYKIEILNPKAKNLLKALADLKFIRMTRDNQNANLAKLLKKIRSRSNDAPTVDEIAKEVEAVRKSRYEK